MFDRMRNALKHIQQKKPLVLCLTNYVTMDLVANSLLALGAAPIMSEEKNELEELVSISNSIYINLGNIHAGLIERVETILPIVKQKQKPLVLDPVGAGATALRTTTAKKCLSYSDIVRGNASEILSLTGISMRTQGVESSCFLEEKWKKEVFQFADQHSFTVVVSGASDYITNGRKEETLSFGSALMTTITGMGCALTAVIAAFRGVVEDSYEAALLGTLYFSLCGTLAARSARQPASFRTAFIDAIYSGATTELQSCYVE